MEVEVELSVDPTERFSFISHALGALASIAGLVVLVARAQGPLAVTTTAIYTATLVLLLGSSALHHAIHPHSPVGARALRRLDHIAIFGLIAGTYTPVALVGLGGGWGWSIFGVVWGVAVAGTLVKVYWLHAPRWLSVGLYILMGWIVVVAIVPLLERFTGEALGWMAAGGVFYTGGALMYGFKRPDPFPQWLGFHGLWHVFVLAGAAAHWWFVYAFVL